MSPTTSKVLANAIAGLVFGLWSLSLVLLGYWISVAWPSTLRLILVGIFGFFVLLSIPGPKRLPKHRIDVSRGEALELFRLFDEVSLALEAPTVDVLSFDSAIGASTTEVGFRRRTWICLGLPLWEVLDPHERVALVAHEVAHRTNGDLRRGAVIGASLDVLNRWSSWVDHGSFKGLLRSMPDLRWEDAAYRAGAWLLTRPFYSVINLLLRTQYRLTMAVHRQSEFDADRSASEVAGSKAVLALLERVLLAVSIDYAISQAVNDGSDLFDSARDRFLTLPRNERQLLRKAAMEEGTGIDSTHPPTGQRIEALQLLPSAQAEILLDHGWNRRIDAELADIRAIVSTQIRERAASPI